MSNYLVNGSDLIPVGSIFWLATSTASPGYLICDGSAVSRITYKRLFDTISVTYGSGNGVTTFNLPDLRGCFIRGYDNGRTFDSGRTFGSYQADGNKSHNHIITQTNHTHGASQSAHNHIITQTDHTHDARQSAHKHTGGVVYPWTGDLTVSGVAEQNQVAPVEDRSRFTDTGSATPAITVDGAKANITLDDATPDITVAGAKANITINDDGENESRPKNIALLPIIKF